MPYQREAQWPNAEPGSRIIAKLVSLGMTASQRNRRTQLVWESGPPRPGISETVTLSIRPDTEYPAGRVRGFLESVGVSPEAYQNA